MVCGQPQHGADTGRNVIVVMTVTKFEAKGV
jgi:hypothetical protein